jgi:DNA replication protein DnaC
MDFSNEVKRYHYDSVIDDLGVGERYYGCFFGVENEIQTDLQKASKQWAHDLKSGNKEKPFLMMLGTCGTGKTWAGLCGLLEVGVYLEGRNEIDLSHSRSNVGFFTHYDVAESVFFHDKAMADRKKMFNAHVLMLDDLRAEGTGKVSDAFIAWMDELINYRYSHNKPTIITANTTAEKFQVTYGERVVDRIQDAGVILKVNSKSLRKK